jgi:hypothetical protein
MRYMNCPRCGLAVRLRFAYLTLERCPRCLAQDCVPMSMYISNGPRTRPTTERSPRVARAWRRV